MVADQTYSGIAPNPAGAAGLPDGEGGESGPGFGLFGKGSEPEIAEKARVLHLFPRDRGEIAGDQAEGNAGGMKPPQGCANARTHAPAEVGLHSRIKVLSFEHDR